MNIWPEGHLDLIAYTARKIVNGMRTKTYNAGRPDEYSKLDPADGEFSAEFQRVPLVRMAISEGWDADLRMHCLRLVRRRLMVGVDCSNPGDMMPDDKWIGHARANAERRRLAAEWRGKMLVDFGSIDEFQKRVGRFAT